MSKLLSIDQSHLVRTLSPTRENFDQLARCYNSFKDPDSWPEGFGGTRIFTGEFLEKQMKDQDMTNYFVILAPDDPEKIVGTCFVGETENVKNGYYVQLLGVDPSYQGQSLGKALLLHATRFAISKNAKLLTLETWGGNLKAMPLYKKQGYKWRPDTAVYMENYIPQIITNKFLSRFFSSLNQSWYESYKPKVTQFPDILKEGDMVLYEYVFQETPSKSLKVWIDRTIGSINGFHLINEEYNLLIKATTPNSKAYIDFDSFTTTLLIENNSKKEVNLTIGTNATSKIELQEKVGDKSTITISPNTSTKFEVIGTFAEDTDELNTKIHTNTLTEEGIVFKIEIDNTRFDLTVGKVPVKAIKASLTPSEYHSICSHAFDLPISLESFMDNPSIKVDIIVDDGEIIRFTEHEKKSVQLSKYDTLISYPVKIPQTQTMVDYFSIKIVNEEGAILSSQRIALPIFSSSKTITYKQDQQVFLENKHLRLSYYKKPQPNSNEILVVDKLRKLQVTGFPIILGYPFEDEGSEFSTKRLSHKVEESNQGLLLSSWAISDKKSGIKVVRKILVPDDKAEFQVSWVVENTSKESKNDLGIQNHSYWWRNALPMVSRIIPLNEGIMKLDITAFPIDTGKDPKEFKEGWHVSVYETGSIGLIFDPLQVYEFTIGRFHPNIFFKLPVLAPGEKYESTPITYVFENSWQAIRKLWLEKSHPSPSYDLEFSKKATSHKQIGLKSSSGETIAHGVIHNKKDKLFTSIDAFRETVFKGELNLELQGIIPSPQKIRLPETKGRMWNKEISLIKDPKEKIFKGELTFDSLTRIYDYPVTLVLYDDTKKVSTSRNDERAYYEVDNGVFNFKASEKYRGNIYSLSFNDEPNLLHNGTVQFPEIGPFLWFNEFYGGIGPIVRSVGTWDMTDFNKLKFEPSTVTRGKWQGVSFKSEIMTYSTKLKGLQVTTEYLTLPDSPLLLVQAHITNHSELTRNFFIVITSNLETSNSTNDFYYLEDSKSNSGYLTYRMQNWESTVYLEKELYPRWVAYQRSGSKHFIAAVLPSAYLNENMYPYSPNLKVISLNLNANRMKIKPKETMTFRSLFFFTDQLSTIPPLVNSNFLDLMD